MTVTYEARICDPFGNLLASVANFTDTPTGGGAALSYVLVAGKIGVLRLTLPASFDDTLLRLDGRIGVWRSINGRPPVLDGQTVFFIRTWDYDEDMITVTAYNANHLRLRRVVAYFGGTTYTVKAAAASSNQIKAVVNENMLGGIVAADRQGVETQADISAYLSNQVNLGNGQSVAIECAWRNLDDLISEICDASTFAGTYMVSDIVAPTERTLELRTYADVRGVDHRMSSSSPVLLSPESGSLANCHLTIDRSQEITFAIAGGTDENSQRTVATSIDTVRVADSPFNRIELFNNYSNTDDSTTLQDVADAMVRAGRPRIEFTADLVETDSATRGLHYDYGDLVTASFRNKQYDCRLDVIEVSIGNGNQTSRVRLRSEL